ncbi:MAG: IS200/IS605 family transposase [bacterium]
MSKIFHKLYYHAVWTTYLRQPEITEEIEKYLFPFFINKAKRFDCCILGCNSTENHVHMAIQIPPAESVSDIIGKLKGSSSYFLNKEIQITNNFYWQDGFGVLSFAEKDLPKILRYIANQKQHHKTNKINLALENYGDE